jgi:predicted nuclease of predicted toxin-antitoxin system
MIRLVIDMNLSPVWVTELRNHSVEAIHWSEVGSPTAPDEEIMAWAREHGYMVLTHDLDFGALLAATGNSGPSVIQLRAEDVRPANMAVMVVSAIQSNSDDLLRGALVTIHPNRMRSRVLPLHSSSPKSK